jgi:hypothetical protein
LLPRRVVPQSDGDIEVRAAALAVTRAAEGRPEIDIDGTTEVRGHDADHRIRLATQQNRFADNFRIALEHPAPQIVAQHCHGRTAGHVLGCSELAPAGGRHAEDAEKPCADTMLVHERRRAADDEIRPVTAGTTDGGVNRGRVIAHGFPRGAVHRDGPVHAARRGRRALDERQPLGGGIRQRPDQDRVGQAEHGRTGANHQRQRDDGRDGERRRPAQHAQRETHVTAEDIDDREAAHVLNLLERGPRVAEGQPRFAPGRLGCAAACDELFDIEIEVRPHFLGPIALARASGTPLPQ